VLFWRVISAQPYGCLNMRNIEKRLDKNVHRETNISKYKISTGNPTVPGWSYSPICFNHGFIKYLFDYLGIGTGCSILKNLVGANTIPRTTFFRLSVSYSTWCRLFDRAIFPHIIKINLMLKIWFFCNKNKQQTEITNF